MKNLIIDPFVHYPTAYKVFGEADYVCGEKGESLPNGIDLDLDRFFNLTRDCVSKTYGISPIGLGEISGSYDKVFIVFTLNYLNDPGTEKWDPLFSGKQGETQLVQEYMRHIYDQISKIKYNKIVFLDGHDRAFVSAGEKWLNEMGLEYSAIFKREYRRTHTYDYSPKVFPFPFQTFGEKNPTWRFFEEKKSGSLREPGCVWAGGPIKHFPVGKRDEWCNRHDMLVAIQKKLVFPPKLPQDQFLDLFNRYKSFLHLNGTGHLCARFFEGLSRESLMITEEMDTVFPFDNGEYFAEEAVFVYAMEFLEKAEALESSETLYNKCLEQQKYIVNKYYNYDWINNYVNEKI